MDVICKGIVRRDVVTADRKELLNAVESNVLFRYNRSDIINSLFSRLLEVWA